MQRPNLILVLALAACGPGAYTRAEVVYAEPPQYVYVAPPARRTRTAEARRTPPPRACRRRGRRRRGQARVSGWDAASALQGEVSIKDSATPRFVTAAIRRWRGSLRLTAP